VKNPLNAFDDEGRGFLERGAKLKPEGIEKVHSASLFRPQGHQNESGEEKNNNKNEKMVPS